MNDLEENINHQEYKSLEIETGLETFLEIIVMIHKTEIEGIQEGLIGLEINLEIIQVIDEMIEQEMVEMILGKKSNRHCEYCNHNVILGDTVGRCRPMLKIPECLRRWMIQMMTHQAPSTPW